MGMHAYGDAPAADAIVERAIAGIGAEIDAMSVPKLRGVVLGGGYARGEGGVKTAPDGSQNLSNDLDFYVVAEDGSSAADFAAIAASLSGVAERWSAKLSVDVDFSPAKTPWRMKHDEERIMIQELVHAWCDVAGLPGKELFAHIVRRAPQELPWMEAARLLMNRGIGLLLASAGGDPGFVARNLNKCVLGAGDAELVAAGKYAWKAEDRAAALGDAMYSAALEWKFRPRPGAPFTRDEARARWLAAFARVMDAGRAQGALRRSVRQAARWVARRRTLGELGTFGRDCTVRVLASTARAVETDSPLSPSLKKDWEIFN